MAWIAALLLGAVTCRAVYYDQPKTEVLQELGRPASVLVRGDREILNYPNGRIELVGGKVVSIRGFAVAEGPLPAVVERDEIGPTKVESVEAAGRDDAPANQPEADVPPAAAEMNGMPDALAELDRALAEWERPPEPEEPQSLALTAAILGFGLLINWLLMLAALTLTCKYWAVEVSWSGLMIASGVDTAVRTAVATVGKVLLKLPALFYADEAIALVVLVFVLRKVSYNQRLSQAVTIAMTSKVFSVLVGSIVALAVMSAIFSGRR
jgi:hypothetical protein